MLKKTGFTLLFVGVFLGIAQVFFYHEITIVHREKIAEGITIGCQALSPECGVCLHKVEDGYCLENQNKYARGFPLFTTGSGVNYKTNQPLGIEHIVNVFLFLIPGSAILFATYMKSYENNKHKSPSKR